MRVEVDVIIYDAAYVFVLVADVVVIVIVVVSLMLVFAFNLMEYRRVLD